MQGLNSQQPGSALSLAKPDPVEYARENDHHEAFTLLDPDLFCLDGLKPNMTGRFGQNAVLGFSGAMRALAFSRTATLKTAGRVLGPLAGTASAGMTTVALVKDNKNRAERQLRLQQAAGAFLSEAGCQWHEYLDDVMGEDYQQRSQVAQALGTAGDYISAGSSFLLMYPPAAAAGFVTGLAVRAGGEVGKQVERAALKNIYELIAHCILKNLAPREIGRLRKLLQDRGLSANGGHRMEVWAFCRALEATTPTHAFGRQLDLLSWLQVQLMLSIDALRASKGFLKQCRREFLPALNDGQITIGLDDGENPSIQRLQVPSGKADGAHDNPDWIASLQARLLMALEQVSTEPGNTQRQGLAKAVARSIAASMVDFDSASMLAAKIAYRLYIDTSGEGEAIACVDEDAYRDCHFLASAHSLDVCRCGIFKIKSANTQTPTAYIPYMRTVQIPLDAAAEQISEKFEFLSGKWFSSAQAAARELPKVGIPARFVQWARAPHAFIESQLSLLAQGFEQALATGPNADRALSQCLALGFGSQGVEAEDSDRRAFIDPAQGPRRQRRAPGTTGDECLAAAAFLLKASCYSVEVNTVKVSEIESMIAVRQQALRGVREYLAHVLPTSSAAKNPHSWEHALRAELEASLADIEIYLLKLVDQLCK